MTTTLKQATIALIGNRSAHKPAHKRLDALAPHLAAKLTWLPSETVQCADDLSDFDGIWVVPGSPYASQDGVLEAIRHARESTVPFLGTCGGFQHALLEYARHCLDLVAAEDMQYDTDAAVPLIIPLVCSLKGERARLHLQDGSRLAEVFDGQRSAVVTYHCSYGLNPRFADLMVSGELVVSARDEHGAPRAVELPNHPFFVGTLFQPELSSTPSDHHPLITAFVAAATQHANEKAAT